MGTLFAWLYSLRLFRVERSLLSGHFGVFEGFLLFRRRILYDQRGPIIPEVLCSGFYYFKRHKMRISIQVWRKCMEY